MHPDILKIRSTVHEMAVAGVEVEFLWVPAHNGIDGNETVDKLASETDLTPLNKNIKAYYKDFYGIQKQLCLRKW